jgi:23S rRNA (guanosine2251-2'-O)-methyltransferase
MVKDQEIIFGLHTVRHALEQHPESILGVWIQDNKRSSPQMEGILRLAQVFSISVEYPGRAMLDQHSGHAAHQGVIARRRPGGSAGMKMDLGTLLMEGRSSGMFLFLVLDGIQDPHNLGACLRTANAAGVDAVILPKDRAVAVTPAARKVASGAAENTPVISVTNLARTLRELKQAGIWTVGTDDKAEQSLYDVDLNVPLAIVLGAEGQGMRENTRKHCDFLVCLPMLGIVESLNVSVATGICLYEALRQRKTVPGR